MRMPDKGQLTNLVLEIESGLGPAKLNFVNHILAVGALGLDDCLGEFRWHFLDRGICAHALTIRIDESNLGSVELQLILTCRYFRGTEDCWSGECNVVGFSRSNRQTGYSEQ